MFFCYVVISILHSFQETVLLNLCIIFPRTLILSFINKVTTGTISRPSQSSSASKLMKEKSRDLQKLLKYFNEIAIYVFEGGIRSCCGRGD